MFAPSSSCRCRNSTIHIHDVYAGALGRTWKMRDDPLAIGDHIVIILRPRAGGAGDGRAAKDECHPHQPCCGGHDVGPH
jgi:hypothetical protein